MHAHEKDTSYGRNSRVGTLLNDKRRKLNDPRKLFKSSASSSSLIFRFTMAGVQEVQLQIKGGSEDQGTHLDHQKDANTNNQHQSSTSMFIHLKWWLLVALNIFLVLAGQTAGTLLGRFYYNEGGNSKWMATLVGTAGFPILLIPLFFFHSPQIITHKKTTRLIFICIALGLIITADNLMYSYGLLYLPVSTFSLICATQLAFNTIFSYFLNSQKFTHLIFNSVVLLTFSAALLGVRSDKTHAIGENYPVGFVLTLGASATFSLILSLVQLTFQKVLKTENFSVVLELQLCTSIVATGAAVVGLFASGQWRSLRGEMKGFTKGEVSYIMTLVWTAISWQVSNVGVMGLTFVVSSLFSNVISTVALPVVPIFAVVLFRDKMDGVMVISMLIAIWGFMSYIYQQYLDDVEIKKGKRDLKGVRGESADV